MQNSFRYIGCNETKIVRIHERGPSDQLPRSKLVSGEGNFGYAGPHQSHFTSSRRSHRAWPFGLGVLPKFFVCGEFFVFFNLVNDELLKMKSRNNTLTV